MTLLGAVIFAVIMLFAWVINFYSLYKLNKAIDKQSKWINNL